MSVEWTVNNEIQLFHAMTGHKPVGINRHFQMLVIHSKLSQSLNTELSSDIIWKKLETLYDLQALNQNENSALHEVDEIEFSLPSEYLASESPLATPKSRTSSRHSSPIRMSDTVRARLINDTSDGGSSSRRRRGTPDPEEWTPRRPKRNKDSPAPKRRK